MEYFLQNSMILYGMEFDVETLVLIALYHQGKNVRFFLKFIDKNLDLR
jgi:hypothetical protein